MKLVLELIDGFVINAKLINERYIRSVIPVSPYRTSDELGNAYARILRQRDHRISRGIMADIDIVDECNPEEYLFKLKRNSEYCNSGETNERRLHRVRYYFSVFSPFYFNDMFRGNAGDYLLLKYFDEEFYVRIYCALRKHEEISYDDLELIYNKLKFMSNEEREFLCYRIGGFYYTLALDEGSGGHQSFELPNANDNWGLKNIAIKFLTAGESRECLGELASLYSRSNAEDSACEIYNRMVSMYSTDIGFVSECKKKQHYLGIGRQILESAEKSIFNKQYGDAIKDIKEFWDKSSGRVRYRCFRRASIVSKICCENIEGAVTDDIKKYTSMAQPDIFECIPMWREK